MPKVHRAVSRGKHKTARHSGASAMDRIKIKRVKRNKKTTTAKEKILAGLGVGSALMGAAAVSPKTPTSEFVRVSEQSGTKNTAIKESLNKIFGVTLGVSEARASEGESSDLEANEPAVDQEEQDENLEQEADEAGNEANRGGVSDTEQEEPETGPAAASASQQQLAPLKQNSQLSQAKVAGETLKPLSGQNQSGPVKAQVLDGALADQSAQNLNVQKDYLEHVLVQLQERLRGNLSMSERLGVEAQIENTKAQIEAINQRIAAGGQTQSQPDDEQENAEGEDAGSGYSGPLLRMQYGAEPEQPEEIKSESPAAVSRTSGGTYKVKKGDTLWDIAAKHYGDGRKWRDIMAVNAAKIKSPRTLQIGTLLVLPALQKTAAATKTPLHKTAEPKQITGVDTGGEFSEIDSEEESSSQELRFMDSDPAAYSQIQQGKNVQAALEKSGDSSGLVSPGTVTPPANPSKGTGEDGEAGPDIYI